MAVLLTDDATDCCIRCHDTDKTSIVEIRPHHVWVCTRRYSEVLAGAIYYDPVVPRPVTG